jgi:hypothetical protein
MTSNSGEAPTIETPAELPENPDSVEYEIDDDSKIKISIKEETIYFNVTQISLIPRDYKACFTVEQLCDINKFFLNFQDAKEIVDGILKALEQKNANIKFIDNKCIIQMINPITKLTFEINLNLEEKDTNSRVCNLENYISEQNKKMILMEERLKILEEKMAKYGQTKKEEEEKNLLFTGSEILTNEAKDMLLNWLPRKPNKITLLMNSNRDGDSTKSFMNKCNGKCPTLAVIKTINGYVFGGYTTQMWKEGEVKDNNAFVFSIDKKRKYNNKQPEHAIGFRMNNFWLFGYTYNAIVVRENCTKRNDNYVGNKTYDIPEQYELNGGEQYFIVKSFEIYHIEY